MHALVNNRLALEVLPREYVTVFVGPSEIHFRWWNKSALGDLPRSLGINEWANSTRCAAPTVHRSPAIKPRGIADYLTRINGRQFPASQIAVDAQGSLRAAPSESIPPNGGAAPVDRARRQRR
jgi:hypothetical protein